jgi:hypothetical protein
MTPERKQAALSEAKQQIVYAQRRLELACIDLDTGESMKALKKCEQARIASKTARDWLKEIK